MFGVRFQVLVLRGLSLTNSTTQLGFVQNRTLFAIRLLSSSSSLLNTKKRLLGAEENDIKQRSYVVSYLINSCGLSPEHAKSASKKIYFETPETPDAVLSLLRDYGFTNSHISRLIQKKPQLLLVRAKRTLLPKLEFLRSTGFSNSDFARNLSLGPAFLVRSLEKHLIPCYNVLKSVLLCDGKVVKTLSHNSWIVMGDLVNNLALNLSVLEGLGLPRSIICSLVTSKPRIACLDSDKFSQYVKKVIELGFDPSKYTFVDALSVILQMTHKTWKHKMEIYGRWGLSEIEIWAAFKRYPMYMTWSEKKIMKTMDFLVNKMGWRSADVVRVPSVLSYSLEKRIIPRCSVIRVLLLKGLLNKEIAISSVLTKSEKSFLDLFVTKYQEEVPQMLSIFLGEMNILELGFRFEEKSGAGNL